VRTEHWDHGTFTLTVGSSSISTGYSESSTAESIATALCSLMTSSYPIQCTGTSDGLITVVGTADDTISCTQYSYYVGSSFSPCERAGFNVAQVVIVNVAPAYKVISILYDAPGNGSQNGYTNSTTYGTTTTITDTFTAGTTTTYTVTLGFGLFSSSMGWSYGDATVTGSTATSSYSVTDAAGVANKVASGAPNVINHQEDMFLVWLNPYVTLVQTGPKTLEYAVSVPPQPGNSSAPQTQDVIQVFASDLTANSKGNSSVPLSKLEQQVLPDGEALPGMASICANRTYYPNSCSADPNGQCGCVPKDFAGILNQDLLLTVPSTTAPSTVNNSTNGNRFLQIMSSGSNPLVENLSGPDMAGGNIPINTFAVSDTTQSTYASTMGNTSTVAYSGGATFGGSYIMGSTLSVVNTDTYTWSDSESFGGIYGQTHQAMVTLSSSTVGCDQDIFIFEDTVFHTFAFQQPAGNASCP
jgi:hypothetical protein